MSICLQPVNSYALVWILRSVPDEYCEHLQDEKILSKDTLRNTVEAHTKLLTEQFMQADEYVPPHYYLQLQWKAIVEPDYVSTTWDTGTGIDLLRFVGAKSVECPPDFVSSSTDLLAYTSQLSCQLHYGELFVTTESTSSPGEKSCARAFGSSRIWSRY